MNENWSQQMVYTIRYFTKIYYCRDLYCRLLNFVLLHFQGKKIYKQDKYTKLEIKEKGSGKNFSENICLERDIEGEITASRIIKDKGISAHRLL